MAAACTEAETDLGLGLQDPSTFYDGKCDTAYGVAYTVFDDSLLTSGQMAGLVGTWQDDFYGFSEAVFYTKVSTPTEGRAEFDEYCRIDSVVLSLAVTDIMVSGGAKSYQNLHFEVYQLADTLQADTVRYYAFDEVPVNSRNCFYNDVYRLVKSDSMVVNLRLGGEVARLFEGQGFESREAFEEHFKGLRVRLVNDGTPTMLALNFASQATRLTVHFTYTNIVDSEEDSIPNSMDFVIGSGTTHFNQFKNHYVGPLALFNQSRTDSLDGAQYLYLTSMGGTNIKLNMDAFVRQFHEAHPYAVVHNAELILPVSNIGETERPDLIATYKCYLDGALVTIPDLLYNMGGYDGSYHEATGCYRIRITQHFQKLLDSGQDLGTLMVVNGRRSSTGHVVINGYQSSNPIRVHFIYSE